MVGAVCLMASAIGGECKWRSGARRHQYLMTKW
jgi:hypothetical protein